MSNFARRLFLYRPLNTILGRPYITVSSKGISNGKSYIVNDGADFGPDTTKGATKPDQIGSPYTTTSGIQEALNYATIIQAPVVLGPGEFQINDTINLPYIETYSTEYSDIGGGLVLEGSGPALTVIQSSLSNQNVFQWENSSTYNHNYKIGNMTINAPNNTATVLYLNQDNEASYHGLIHDITIQHGSGAALSLDSNEDTILVNAKIEGYAIGVYWHIPDGSAVIIDSQLFSGAWLEAQHFPIVNTVIGPYQVLNLEAIGNQPAIYDLNNIYLNNGGSSGLFYPTIYVHSQSSGYKIIIRLVGSMVNPSSLQLNNPFIVNGSSSNPPAVYLSVVDTLLQSSTLVNLFDTSLSEVYADITRTHIPLTNVNVNNSSITLSSNPPASGSVYQNTYPFPIRILLPVYAVSSGTAGSISIYLGESSTPSLITAKYISGATSSASTDLVELVVPPGWYYEFTYSSVTSSTATTAMA